MRGDFDALKKIRFLRDLIFDAKFKDIWLYVPCEEVAFQWMRLVSEQIQSTKYDPFDFLRDVEIFATDIRNIDGIEKERVDVFDAIVRTATKEINHGLLHNCWTPGLNDTIIKQEASAVEVKTRTGNKSNNRSTPKPKILNLLHSSGDGIADLFREATDAAITLPVNGIDPLCPPSPAIEATAERVSIIFQSLYDHGSQHGLMLLSENEKKKKAGDAEIQNLSNRGNTSMSSLQQQMSEFHPSCLTSSGKNNSKEITVNSNVVVHKSAKVPVARQRQVDKLEEKLPTAKKPTVQLKRVKKEVEHVTGVTRKRARSSIADISTSSWLKVDLSRDTPCMPPAVTAAASPHTRSADSEANISPKRSVTKIFEDNSSMRADDSSSGVAVLVSAGSSKFTGVYPKTQTQTQTPGSSSKRTASEGEVVYSASIYLLGRNVDLGVFPSEELAARAHDRALCRAIGPSNCRAANLNYPVTEYACEPLSRFIEFDENLKAQLFGTAWKGLKHCDFGFLLVRGAQNQGHASLEMQYQTLKMSNLVSAIGAVSGVVVGTQSQPILSTSTTSTSSSIVNSSTSRSSTRAVSMAHSVNTNTATVNGGLYTTVPVTSATTTSSSSSLANSSSSLKSKIVRAGEIERGKVAPPPIGTAILVANVPNQSTAGNRGGYKGGRGRSGAKLERLPVQRAVYLGAHAVPGRFVLGFLGGSRVFPGVTFLKRFPEGIYTGVTVCEVSGGVTEEDAVLSRMYGDQIRAALSDPNPTRAWIGGTIIEETVTKGSHIASSAPSSAAAAYTDASSESSAIDDAANESHSNIRNSNINLLTAAAMNVKQKIPSEQGVYPLPDASSPLIKDEPVNFSVAQSKPISGVLRGSSDVADVAVGCKALDAVRNPQGQFQKVSQESYSDVHGDAATFLLHLSAVHQVAEPNRPVPQGTGTGTGTADNGALNARLLTPLPTSTPSVPTAPPGFQQSIEATTRVVAPPSSTAAMPPNFPQPIAAPPSVVSTQHPEMLPINEVVADRKTSAPPPPVPPRAVEGNPSVHPRAVGGNPSVPSRAVGGNPSVPPRAVEGNPSVPPRAVEGNPSVQPRAVEGNSSVPPRAVGGNLSVPPRAVEGNPSVHPRAVEGNPSVQPRAVDPRLSKISMVPKQPPIPDPPTRPVTLRDLIFPCSLPSQPALSSSSQSATAAPSAAGLETPISGRQGGDVVLESSEGARAEDDMIDFSTVKAIASDGQHGLDVGAISSSAELTAKKRKGSPSEVRKKKKKIGDDTLLPPDTDIHKAVKVGVSEVPKKSHKKKEKEGKKIEKEVKGEERKKIEKEEKKEEKGRDPKISKESKKKMREKDPDRHKSKKIKEPIDAAESSPPTEVARESIFADIFTESLEGISDQTDDPFPWAPVPLLLLGGYKANSPQPQLDPLMSPEQYSNGRSRRSTSSSSASNLETYNTQAEKHRVNEIPPWACYVLGEEVNKLRQCLKAAASTSTCDSDPSSLTVKPPTPSISSSSSSTTPGPQSVRLGLKMYMITPVKQSGWELCLDFDVMKADDIMPKMALRQLRCDIVRVLSKSRDDSEGLDTVCPAQIFRGVQVADSDLLGTDNSTDTTDPAGTVPAPARYVAIDIFAGGPRFLGLFSSPLEAALIREQILDRDGLLVSKKRAGEDRNCRHCENFTVTQWALLTDMGAIVDKFVRSHCVLST